MAEEPPASSWHAGGRPLTQADLDRVRARGAALLYALGDVNGDDQLDAQDVSEAQRAQGGAQDVACSRAADINFDNAITAADLSFLASISGYNERRLFASAHMTCQAFAPVAGVMVGQPGESLPLLLLGGLRTGVDSTGVQVRVGPAVITSVGEGGQDFTVRILDSAEEGARVQVGVFSGEVPAGKHRRVFLLDIAVTSYPDRWEEPE